MAIGTGISGKARRLTGGTGAGGSGTVGGKRTLGDPYYKQMRQQKATALQNAAPTGGKLVFNPSTGTVTPARPKSSNPYIQNANRTADDFYKVYQGQYNALKEARDYANQNTNNTYNGMARNIYNMYMQNARNRRQLASNVGMTGGAVENLMVGNENNYNTNYATSEGLRTRALADNEANFRQGTSNALTEYQKSSADAYRDARDSSLAAKEAKREENLNVYKETVGGFDTVEKCNKEIKRLRKNKPTDWKSKVRMIQAQKAAVKAMK